MISDAWLVEKAYGKCHWHSLPPMMKTQLESEAVAYLEDASALQHAES
jgi:hypothetical protein